MKLAVRSALAGALFVLQVHPACAQWHGSVGVGGRSAIHNEYDMAGRRLVREAGWLPGLALDAGWTAGALTVGVSADGYRGSIGYHGQTQAGAAADSTTATTLASVRVGAAWAVGPGYSIHAALELDGWKRDIRGSGGNAGLQESYRTGRLLVGAGKTWRPAGGEVGADAALVISGAEHLKAGFSGLFDPVSFDTRPSRGIRIGARLRPAFARHLEVSARYSWSRIGRSGDAPLTRNGQFIGTVAQPEHDRQAFTLATAVAF